MPDFTFELGSEFMGRLLLAFTIAFIIFILVQVIRRLVRRYVDEPERQFRITRTVGRMGGVLAAVFFLGALFETTGNLITVLTVVGAGLAIAMRETLMSFFGWTYIAIRSPYRAGDRIEVNGIRGDVIDVSLLHTTMMEIGGWVDADQSTGRLVHIPNSVVFLHGIYNYTRGFRYIWNEITVTVTFRSDWQAARSIMLSLANESAVIVEQQVREEIKKMAQEYLIYYNILTPFVYVHIVENGVRLTLRYLCEARKRRGTAHALTLVMLEQFKAHGHIEIAYPQLGVTQYEAAPFGPLPETAGTRRSEPPTNPSTRTPL